MSDAYTLLSDLISSDRFTTALAGEFPTPESVLAFAGPTPESPIQIAGLDELLSGGQYLDRPRWAQIDPATLITRRDITSVSAIDTQKLTQANDRAVVCNMKVGPIQFDPSAQRLAGLGDGSIEMEFARQTAKGIRVMIQQYAVSALYGIGCGVGTSAHVYSPYGAASRTNLSNSVLLTGLGKMSDRMDKITSWIFRPETWTDLTSGQLSTANNVGALANAGLPATLSRQYAILAHSILRAANGTYYYKYRTLGIGPGAISIRFLNAPRFMATNVVDLASPQVQVRADFDIAVGATYCQWDKTNGGANPTEASLQTSTNWDDVNDDDRQVPVIVIETNYSLD